MRACNTPIDSMGPGSNRSGGKAMRITHCRFGDTGLLRTRRPGFRLERSLAERVRGSCGSPASATVVRWQFRLRSDDGFSVDITSRFVSVSAVVVVALMAREHDALAADAFVGLGAIAVATLRLWPFPGVLAAEVGAAAVVPPSARPALDPAVFLARGDGRGCSVRIVRSFDGRRPYVKA